MSGMVRVHLLLSWAASYGVWASDYLARLLVRCRIQQGPGSNSEVASRGRM
jgi:hypothetical protein